MAGRLSRVRQAAKLQKQLTYYMNTYLPKSSRGEIRRGKAGHAVRQIQVCVFPFTVATGGKPIVVTVSEAAFTRLTPMSGKLKVDKTIPEGAEPRPGFIPAKITAFESTGAPTTPRSQVTGEEYKKYPGQSYTCPFGKTSTGDAETMWSKFANIKQEMDSKLGQYGRVSMTVEKFRRV